MRDANYLMQKTGHVNYKDTKSNQNKFIMRIHSSNHDLLLPQRTPPASLSMISLPNINEPPSSTPIVMDAFLNIRFDICLAPHGRAPLPPFPPGF